MNDIQYTLITTSNCVIMAAYFPTPEAAMEAAVEWVQGQAETYLGGPLSHRWTRARAWVAGQGGTMNIVPSVPSEVEAFPSTEIPHN